MIKLNTTELANGVRVRELTAGDLVEMEGLDTALKQTVRMARLTSSNGSGLALWSTDEEAMAAPLSLLKQISAEALRLSELDNAGN